MTQATRLYAELRKRPMSYLELLLTGISTCPWVRLREGLHHLKRGEKLVRGLDHCGRVTYAVKRGQS